MIKPILLLGNPALYEKSVPVEKEELGMLAGLVEDMRDTLMDFRARNGAGKTV